MKQKKKFMFFIKWLNEKNNDNKYKNLIIDIIFNENNKMTINIENLL